MPDQFENIDFVLSIVFTLLAFFVLLVTIVVLMYFSRKKLLAQQLKNKDLQIQNQQEVLNATIDAQEQERGRIARDLHDDIGSKLNVITMNVRLLELDDLEKTERKEIAKDTLQACQLLIESTRQISHNLVPPVLDKIGLHMALDLAPLPYDGKALEPFISANTLSFHHGKHHAAYVNNFNNLAKDTPFASKPLEEVIKATAGDAAAVGEHDGVVEFGVGVAGAGDIGARHLGVAGICFQRDHLPIRRERTGEPDRAVTAERADFEHGTGPVQARDQLQQFALIRRHVHRRQAAGGAFG